MSYERQVIVARQTKAAVSYDRTGALTPVAKTSSPLVEISIADEAKVLAESMAGEVARSQAPVDPLRELADRLLRAYRDRAAKWNPYSGRVIDHIREMFETSVDVFEKNASLDRGTWLSMDEAV